MPSDFRIVFVVEPGERNLMYFPRILMVPSVAGSNISLPDAEDLLHKSAVPTTHRPVARAVLDTGIDTLQARGGHDLTFEVRSGSPAGSTTRSEDSEAVLATSIGANVPLAGTTPSQSSTVAAATTPLSGSWPAAATSATGPALAPGAAGGAGGPVQHDGGWARYLQSGASNGMPQGAAMAAGAGGGDMAAMQAAAEMTARAFALAQQRAAAQAAQAQAAQAQAAQARAHAAAVAGIVPGHGGPVLIHGQYYQPAFAPVAVQQTAAVSYGSTRTLGAPAAGAYSAGYSAVLSGAASAHTMLQASSRTGKATKEKRAKKRKRVVVMQYRCSKCGQPKRGHICPYAPGARKDPSPRK